MCSEIDYGTLKKNMSGCLELFQAIDDYGKRSSGYIAQSAKIFKKV
jgi:hypothetical protein